MSEKIKKEEGKDKDETIQRTSSSKAPVEGMAKRAPSNKTLEVVYFEL